MRRLLIALALVASACGAKGGGGETHDLTATFTLDRDAYFVPADHCIGRIARYSDIKPGLQVTVKSDGETLGIASLPDGFEASGECVFAYKVEDLPKRDFYDITVGDRGAVTFSYDEMVKDNWSISTGL